MLKNKLTTLFLSGLIAFSVSSSVSYALDVTETQPIEGAVTRATKSVTVQKRKQGETCDTEAMKRTLASMNEGDTLVIDRDLVLNFQVVINKSIVIDGTGKTIKCERAGADILLNLKGENITVKNINFDGNLKCRKIIKAAQFKNLNITNCNFTSYTREYGYYATDSAVLIDGAVGTAKFTNCTFEKFAEQYPLDSNYLVRCISNNVDKNGKGFENLIIDNCKFIDVNQAIVADGENFKCTNSYFKGVLDNSLYLFNQNNNINNNVFDTQNDEGIVINDGVYKIYNNTFKNIPNKAIAVNGPTKSAYITDNEFIYDTGKTGNILAYRLNRNAYADGSLEILEFNSNKIHMPNLDTNNDVFLIGEVGEGSFRNNSIICKMRDYQKFIRLDRPTSNFKITNNEFVNTNKSTESYVIDISSNATLNKVSFANNKYTNAKANYITRAEFLNKVNSKLNYTAQSSISFKDVSSNHRWYKDIRIAAKSGYINTSNSAFRPDDLITREEVAVIIANLKKCSSSSTNNIKSLKDYNNISTWAGTSISGVLRKGYMSVNKENKFNPLSPFTYSNVSALMNKIK